MTGVLKHPKAARRKPPRPKLPKAAVIPIGGVTKLDLPPDRLLEAAKGQLEGIVLIGFDKQGEVYAASSYADGGTVLWLMEALKARLLESI